MSANRDFANLLANAWQTNHSNLCVGIDPVIAQFPGRWKNDPARIFDFCAGVIDATYDLVIAFKPQFAYFAENAAEGQLEAVFTRIIAKTNVPGILDAKRGDIGKTAAAYAKEAFVRYKADALTLSPFPGWESIEPYTHYPGKALFLLSRMSNPGSDEMQVKMGRLLTLDEAADVEVQLGRGLESMFLPAYLWIAYRAATQWSQYGQIGLVTGATHSEELQLVRQMAPKLHQLVPGYGAQGASAQDAMSVDTPEGRAIVVSASKITHPDSAKGIDFTGHEEDYFQHCRAAAIAARDELRAARPNTATA